MDIIYRDAYDGDDMICIWWGRERGRNEDLAWTRGRSKITQLGDGEWLRLRRMGHGKTGAEWAQALYNDHSHSRLIQWGSGVVNRLLQK